MRQKGPVNDQPVVAFDIARVSLVVVDAVAVEGQGRVAEQQGRVGHQRLGQCLVRASHGRCGAVGAVRAIDQVLPFGQRQRLTLADVVAHPHEGQRPAAPLLAGDALDPADPLGPHARQQGRVEHQLARRPHPARQAEVGDEPAARRRVSVAAEPVGRLRVPEIDVMREGGQGVANLHRARIAQCRQQRLRAGGVHRVGAGLRAVAVCGHLRNVTANGRLRKCRN